MSVAVVMPTRDKDDRLRLALGALVSQRSAVPFQVVVVDDGRPVGGAAAIANAVGAGSFDLRVVASDGAGRVAARNVGAAATEATLLIFMDDDILVPPWFVEAHVAAHGTPDLRVGPPRALDLDVSEFAATVSGIGSAARGAPRVVHGPLHELPRAAWVVADAPMSAYQRVAAGNYGRTVRNALERMILTMANDGPLAAAPWLACVAANVSMPADLWRAAGGFDESFGTIWGCEDLELGYRLHAGGAQVCLASGAPGVHLTHARPGRWAEHEHNLALFRSIHPDPAVAALPRLLAADGSPTRYRKALSMNADTTI